MRAVDGTGRTGFRGRRAPPLREVGTDPDYRFTLANERTFLAWLRTALGLVAGGAALASLLPGFGPQPLRLGLAALLLALALLISVGSYRRWERAERALRLRKPLPSGILPRIVASGLAVAVLATLLLVLLDLRS
ncbi:MAG: DUF202 domain-containing protein [Pseudonocardiaceae bacterium]|nr:DUF202 domain-containing protein [Pseudonocardiaceae bacterium]